MISKKIKIKVKRKCGQCENELTVRQKTYCSRSCQTIGVSLTNTKIIPNFVCCLYCKETFKCRGRRNSKYCKRSCKDLHQKLIYQGTNNPNYGHHPSEETTLKRKTSLKNYWSNDDNHKKHKSKLKEVAQKLGYHPGTGEEADLKRKKTCLERYGVEHPWMNKEIRQKCEITTKLLYGQFTWQIASDAIPKKNTKIENKIAEILSQSEIKFSQYVVLTCNQISREFDFFLPEHNIVIEADGDYFHANPKFYKDSDLNQTQIYTQKNDQIKNQMLEDLGIKLLRFWENDIHKNDFITALLKEINNENKD